MKDGILKNIVKEKFKDKRNTCSPIYIDNDNKYYSYRGNQELSIWQAKERFAMHIAGRLQYIKQVAKANVEMKLKKRRTKIAETLWEKYF